MGEEEKVIKVDLNKFDLSIIYDALNMINIPGKLSEKFTITKLNILGALKEISPEIFDEKGEIKQPK